MVVKDHSLLANTVNFSLCSAYFSSNRHKHLCSVIIVRYILTCSKMVDSLHSFYGYRIKNLISPRNFCDLLKTTKTWKGDPLILVKCLLCFSIGQTGTRVLIVINSKCPDLQLIFFLTINYCDYVSDPLLDHKPRGKSFL